MLLLRRVFLLSLVSTLLLHGLCGDEVMNEHVRNTPPDATILHEKQGAHYKNTSCNLIVNSSKALAHFQELTNDGSEINLIAFRLHIHGVSKKSTPCCVWATGIGEAIISILNEPHATKCILEQQASLLYNLSIATLTVLKQVLNVNLTEEPTGCLDGLSSDKSVSLVTSSIQKQFLKNGKGKLCYRLKHALQKAGDMKYHCCARYKSTQTAIKMNNQLPPIQSQCKTITKRYSLSTGIAVAIVVFSVWSIFYMSDFEQPDEEFIKITENRMSILSLLHWLFWNDRRVSLTFWRIILAWIIIIPAMFVVDSSIVLVLTFIPIPVCLFSFFLLLESSSKTQENYDRIQKEIQLANAAALEWWKPFKKMIIRVRHSQFMCLLHSITCVFSPKHWREKLLSWHDDAFRGTFPARTNRKVTAHMTAVSVCVVKAVLYFAEVVIFLTIIFVLGVSFPFLIPRHQNILSEPPTGTEMVRLFSCLLSWGWAVLIMVYIYITIRTARLPPKCRLLLILHDMCFSYRFLHHSFLALSGCAIFFTEIERLHSMQTTLHTFF